MYVFANLGLRELGAGARRLRALGSSASASPQDPRQALPRRLLGVRFVNEQPRLLGPRLWVYLWVGLDGVEGVAHALLFGLHVAAVVFVGLDFDGHVFYDFEAESFEAFALDGVVGHQAHFGDTE